MARLARLVIPHQLHHLIQRGNAGALLFRDDEDCLSFLGWLQEGLRQFKVALHAYVLMPDHLHLVLTPSDETGLGKMMQWIGRHYVPYYNRKYQRSGTLWQGRYRATVLEAERYLIPCTLYVESNPLRAGLTHDPLDYRWSSLPHHVGQTVDPLITDHALYWALGNTPFQREAAYRDKLQAVPVPEQQAISDATLKGWLLGSPAFQEAMSRQTERRILPGKRGRPRKRSPQHTTAD